jgi:hypothetical protein
MPQAGSGPVNGCADPVNGIYFYLEYCCVFSNAKILFRILDDAKIPEIEQFQL